MNLSRQVVQVIAGTLLLMIALIPIGCGEQAEDSVDTATIAPATPEPNVDVQGDPALTQTIEPGENRSPYEGGPLEEDEVVGGEEADQTPPPEPQDDVDG